MKTTQRKFDDRPAKRERVPLWLGLMGPSGGGKTYSALRLASGMREVTGGEIFVIDTEARRSLHYAYDEKRGEGFHFRHVAFEAPFGPMDYLAAVEHCQRQGAGVVVIDSMSHEHEGPGGVLEMHGAEVERLAKGRNPDNFKMLAWQKPKQERRRMINTLLQMPLSFVFCFRAKEKTKPVPGGQPESLGFMPIAGDELIYEMTLSALLLPGANGYPAWSSSQKGERMMIKLPRQFRRLGKREPEQLDEKLGRNLAIWATGEPMPTEPEEEQTDDGPPPESEPPREPGED